MQKYGKIVGKGIGEKINMVFKFRVNQRFTMLQKAREGMCSATDEKYRNAGVGMGIYNMFRLSFVSSNVD